MRSEYSSSDKFQEQEGNNVKTEIQKNMYFSQKQFYIAFFYITRSKNISCNVSLSFHFMYFSLLNSENKKDQLKCLRQVTGCKTGNPCRLLVDEDLNGRLLLCRLPRPCTSLVPRVHSNSRCQNYVRFLNTILLTRSLNSYHSTRSTDGLRSGAWLQFQTQASQGL